MRRTLVLVVLTGLFAASPAAGSARSCDNTFGGDLISARDMGCKKAQAVVRAWAHKYKRDGITDRNALRFSCSGRNDPVEGLVMRCARDGKRVVFYANVP